MVTFLTSERFIAIAAVVIVLVVFGRAVEPLVRAGGLLIGLIGTVVGMIAAAVAFCAVVLACLAGLASWAGWNPAPLHLAMLGLAIVLGAALLVGAGIAYRRQKRG